MPSVTLPDGRVVAIPDGLGPRGTAAYLRAKGVAPELTPEAPPDDTYALPSEGGVSDFLTGAGLFVLNRTPGARQAVGNIQPPDTFAADAGAFSVPAGLGILAPGAGWAGVGAQGTLSAGLEALREDSTAGSILGEGALGGGGAMLGDFLGRAVKGAVKAVTAFRRAGLLEVTDEGLRTLANAGGGNVVIDRINRRALTAAAARAIGVNATELSPQVLDQAANTLGQQFEAIVPNNRLFDLSGLPGAIDALPAGAVGPRMRTILDGITDWSQVPGGTVKNLRRQLADRSRLLVGEAGAAADDLGFLVDEVDNAVEAAVPGSRAALRAVREQWKNLKIVESLPSVRKSGQASAGELSARLALEGRGYGTTFLRDSGNVLPGTRGLFDAVRTLTQGGAERAGNPGTAEALTRTAGLAATAGALTGAVTPEAAITAMGTAAATQAAGLASVGGRAPNAGRVGAQIGRSLNPEEERGRQ